MTPLELAPRVLAGTPPWVWAVLGLLIFLGVRRLRPKRTRLGVAALAPAAFVIWSLSGVAALARSGTTGLGHRAQARAPRRDQGELGEGEDAVQHDEDEDDGEFEQGFLHDGRHPPGSRGSDPA